MLMKTAEEKMATYVAILHLPHFMMLDVVPHRTHMSVGGSRFSGRENVFLKLIAIRVAAVAHGLLMRHTGTATSTTQGLSGWPSLSNLSTGSRLR